MPTFEEFLVALEELVQEYTKAGLAIRLKKNPDDTIIQVCGQHATPLARAKSGLDDTLELAYTSAEHHPLWNLLDNSAEISMIVLDKWHNDLTKSEHDQIRWHIQRLERSLQVLDDNKPDSNSSQR